MNPSMFKKISVLFFLSLVFSLILMADVWSLYLEGDLSHPFGLVTTAQANLFGDEPALTFVVNSSADGTDATPGDQVCATAAGVCTLRAAIQESNAYGGDDIIDLRADSYTLTIAGANEDQSATGDLDIIDHLTIQGAGESSTIVDGNQLDRVLHIIGPFNVNLIGMTIQNGKTATGEDGGGIFNSTNANTTLSDSTVRDNEAHQWGGGVANSDSAQIELSNVTVQDNQAGVLGGGIDNHDGLVVLNDSEVIGNTADSHSGGGIYNDGTFRLYNTFIADNQAAQDGGGIFNFDSIVVKRSTVSNNQATRDAGGILNYGDLELHNATVSSNQAGQDAGGVFNLNTMVVDHATIYANQATREAGGIFNDGFATIRNSIVANNTGGNCVRYHTIDSLGHNLDSANSCALSGTGDLTNTDPSLGPLQDNGGATVTHAPLVGSPAIDAIAPVNGCLTVDQRNIVRPQGSGCDMGAHEYNLVDLSISQSDSPDPVSAGQALIYEVNVSNSGESDAFGVVVTDTLPANTTFVSATGEGWSCTHSAGIVRCERSILTLNSIAPPIQIIVNAPDSAGTLTNEVVVDSAITDVNLTNNSHSITTTVTAGADLGISFTSNPTVIEVGDVLTFEVEVENYGPSSANIITATIELPPNQVAYESATGSGWTCSHLNRLITCTRPSLAVGNAPPITVGMTVLIGDNTITSQISVESSANDPNMSNNNFTAIVGDTTSQRADLSIGILDTPDPVGAGSSLLYTLQAHNAGLHEATNITVTNQLPAEVTFVSATGTGWSCNESSQTVICTRATFPVGAGSDILITVTTPDEPIILHNEASISSAISDHNENNNSASQDTQMSARADLEITMSDTPDPVNSGNAVQYILSVQNNGPSTASQIQVTDTLPAELSYVGASGVGWSCGADGQVVSCTRASLPVGPAPEITIDANVSNPGNNTLLNNLATVSSETTDPDASNNSATESTTLALADLSLSISDTPDPVNAGDTVSYIIRATNAGLSAATSVMLENRLPAGTTYLTTTVSGWACAHSNGVVNCTIANLPVGNAPDIIIKVQAPATAGTLTNDATISAVTTDQNTGNNQASQSTQVSAIADLSLSTIGDTDPVTPDAILNYSVQVTNNGPSHSDGITLMHQLPPEVAFDAYTGTGWTCNHNNGSLTCHKASSLGIESAPVLNISVKALTSTSLVEIPITMSGANTDPNTLNNTTSAFLGPDANNIADLSIDISDGSDPVDAGATFTYLLSVNNAGPVTANALTLSQQLPTDALFVSASAPGWSCNQPVTTLTCTRPTLANGASSTIRVTLTAPLAGTALSTSANITSAMLDLNEDNNQDSEETTIISIADLSLNYANLSDTGSSVSYVLQAINNGPSTANSVVLTQTWPSGLTYNNANGADWICRHDSATQTLTCNRNTLFVGVTSELNVTLNKQSNTSTSLLKAEIASAIVDRNLSNNSSQQEITGTTNPPPTSGADLSIGLTGTPDPVEIGQPLTYKLNIENRGPQPAEHITVTQELPTETTFQSISAPDWTCTSANNLVTCTRANLSVNSTAEITILVTAPNSSGRITSDATVQASTQDDNTSNNQASESTTVINSDQPGADLGVIVTDNPDPVLVGQRLTYLVVVENYGGDDAESITLNNNLSSQVTYLSSSGPGWSCDYQSSNREVTCTRDSLAVGTAPTITIEVTAPNTEGSVVNNAIVSSVTSDLNHSNNTSVVRTTVLPITDLSIRQSGPSAPMYAGQQFTYTLTVNNAGPQAATSLIMSNSLPSELTNPIVQEANGWNCPYNSDLHAIICSKEQLNIGDSSITIMGTAPNEGGMMINHATVSATQTDIEPNNNQMSHQMPITAMADLSLMINEQTEQIDDGYLLTYTISINNTGPSTANQLSVVSQLPNGVTITKMEGEKWTCGESNANETVQLTCNKETLSAATLSNITIGLRVPSDMTVEHSASVNANTYDNNMENNQASKTTTPPTTDPSTTLYLPIAIK